MLPINSFNPHSPPSTKQVFNSHSPPSTRQLVQFSLSLLHQAASSILTLLHPWITIRKGYQIGFIFKLTRVIDIFSFLQFFGKILNTVKIRISPGGLFLVCPSWVGGLFEVGAYFFGKFFKFCTLI